MERTADVNFIVVCREAGLCGFGRGGGETGRRNTPAVHQHAAQADSLDSEDSLLSLLLEDDDGSPEEVDDSLSPEDEELPK